MRFDDFSENDVKVSVLFCAHEISIVNLPYVTILVLLINNLKRKSRSGVYDKNFFLTLTTVLSKLNKKINFLSGMASKNELS